MFFKRTIPLIICFVVGVLAFTQEFVPHEWSGMFREKITQYINIILGFAVLISAYSLLHMHVMRIRQRQQGWGYSVFVFIGAAIMIIAGISKEVQVARGMIPAESSATFFDWLYRNVQSACMATIFSILAFFMASAAFRTFRARNTGAALLLITAILIMFGRVPVSESLGVALFRDPAWQNLFLSAVDWLMEYPNMAAQRGILIGISLGGISQSLRILLGIERSYLGGGD